MKRGLCFLLILLTNISANILLGNVTLRTVNLKSNEVAFPVRKLECRIVVHDKIRGFLNWMQEWFRKAVFEQCGQKVLITENKSDLNRANIVVYHAPTHTINGLLKHSKSALKVMVSMEQPKYAPILGNLQYLTGNIDLLMTYSLSNVYPNSNIPNLPITYFPLNIVSPQSVMHIPRTFANKTGYDSGVSVALFASNCEKAGAKERYQYIEELMKHVQIHSYGKCFKNREEPVLPDDPHWPAIAQRRARKIKVLSHYKFYLAFENAPIEDYVSEKVFEGLFAGSLPIYKGTNNIHKFMPSNDSYIDANQLTPKQLADKIYFLANNELEYNKYFSFKQATKLSKEFENIALMSYVHPNALCRLCNYYYDKKKVAANSNITQFS